jgi:hypothetical protein
MAEGSESDEGPRIAELQKRRGAIGAEIAKIERGELSLLDSASLKDRFHQFSTTAFESRFKELMNKNTINEIAAFHAQLYAKSQEISERIAIINFTLKSCPPLMGYLERHPIEALELGKGWERRVPVVLKSSITQPLESNFWCMPITFGNLIKLITWPGSQNRRHFI